MSLIHWWPLNGDTKDYGCENITLTNNGATVDNSGKIGKCYNFNGSSSKLYTNITLTNIMSFCCWVNLANNNEGFVIDARNSSGNGYQPIYIGVNYGIQFYSSQNGTSTKWDAQQCNLTSNSWYHIVVVVTASYASLYINGKLISMSTGAYGYNYGTSLLSIGSRYSNTLFLNGKLNDVRIYDHALSVKEVKELSKGLVLHYNFEDPYAEGTTNLITSVTSSNPRAPLAGNGVDIQTASGDTWCNLNLSTNTVKGGTYTLSFDVSGMSATDVCAFGIYRNGYYYRTDIHNGKNVIKMANFPFSDSSLTFDDGSGRSIANVIQIRNFQFELKDHATPYVNGTREQGTIADNSGYGYDAVCVHSPQIVLDKGNGNYCIDLNNNSKGYLDLGIATFNFITNGTVCFWAKYPSVNYKMILGANDTGSKYLAAWYSGKTWYGANPSFNKVYCDGVERDTPINDNEWHFYSFVGINFSIWGDLKYFLCKYANEENNAFQFHGYLADFKIYATALSAEDIMLEYKRKASIDRQGNIYTGLFEQNANNIALPTRAGIVKANHYVEGGNKTSLQESYVELGYIESSGTQWIDTGFIPNQNSGIEIAFSAGSYANDKALIYGSGVTYANRSFELYSWDNKMQFNYNTCPDYIGSSPEINTIVYAWQIKRNFGFTKSDGTTYKGAHTEQTFTCPYTLTLFALHRTEVYIKPNNGLKIYSCRLYDNDILIHHFIPAKRKSDNTIGLYDLVNKQFYTNQGTGTFTAGPELNKLNVIYTNELKEI